MNALSRRAALSPRAGRTLLWGGLLFAAGLAAARLRLPEWRNAPFASAATLRPALAAALERGGFAARGEPLWSLATSRLARGEDRIEPFDPAYASAPGGGADWLARSGRGPYAVAESEVSEGGAVGRLRLVFAADGTVCSASWVDPERWTSARAEEHLLPVAARLRRLLARPPERLGTSDTLSLYSTRLEVAELGGSVPPESAVTAITAAAGTVSGHRSLGDAEGLRQHLAALTLPRLVASRAPTWIAALMLFGLVGVAGARLLAGRRLDWRQGLVLGGLAALSALPQAIASAGGDPIVVFDSLLSLAFGSLALAALWAVAESRFRQTRPGFAIDLDPLAAGRLGPRLGGALVAGFGAGAGLAGLWLLFFAVAATLPGLAPVEASVALPLFAGSRHPLGQGLLFAAVALLAEALLAPSGEAAAGRPSPGARRAFAAAAAGILLAGFTPLHPWPFAVAAATAFAALLQATLRRQGLAALLVAAFVGFLLPAAALAFAHFAWLPGTAAATTLLAALPLVAGAIGRRRSALAERHAPQAAIARRLEEEERRRHEMDLLARMQLGLLPAELPRLPGWEVAARSLLANEAGGDLYDFVRDDAGGLWIAAGDVAGHGFSCAIALAMTKAGLASLIDAGRRPAEVLERLDAVLRRAGEKRAFVSLLLLRLDPESGEVLLANAGHPYPLLASAGEVEEIELPGLPLAQGPPRRYAERRLVIPLRAALVLASDGLVEAADRGDESYGAPRLVARLAAAGERGAADLVDWLLADWEAHRGGRAAEDDTTLVVLRRLASAPSPQA